MPNLQSGSGHGDITGALGGGCFTGRTVVKTPIGLRPICEMAIGSEILCVDDNGNTWVSYVTDVHIHEDPKDCEIWNYELSDGFVIQATPNHYFWCDDRFEEIGKLAIGSSLQCLSGETRQLASKSYSRIESKVYNLTVAVCHNYFVGESEILISNLGGGKAAKSPKEASDSGRSTSRAYVLEAISEGVIEGLIGGDKGILLDKTPVRNNDGSLNFENFDYKFRRGGATQSIVSGDGEEIASETSVNVEIKKSTGSVSRAIVNSELDLIRVRVSLQLNKYEKNGDITGTNLEYKIEIKQGSAAFQTRYQNNPTAKFASPIELEYAFNVNNVGGTIDTFQVRITRITNDSTDQRLIQKLTWVSYTEVILNKLNYPYTAYIALQFSPEQFSSIPQRQYKVGGRRVKVPSNATVMNNRGLNFSGTWDGTLITPDRACADPVWQLYDLLTNKRYGFGRYIEEALIDKTSLYACSRYNNETITTPLGYSERRYSCNTQLQSAEKAWDLINAFCSACHMKPYWADGTVKFWQDRPGTVIRQFTQADISGRFVYSSTAIRARFTVARITWNDPEDSYQRAVETVEDIEGINKYGIRETEIAAFGCTSRALAIRVGRWVLYSSRYETRAVTFTARSYAAYCRPGEIIQVADPEYANMRYGGLIAASTTISITIDSPVTVTPLMTLTAMLPDNSLETKPISSNGITSVITVSTPFSQVPNVESNWIVNDPAALPQYFRVLSVSPSSGDPTKVEINAIQYSDAKFSAIEDDTPVEDLPTRVTAPVVVESVSSVYATTVGISNNGVIDYTLIAGWKLGSNAAYVKAVYVQYSRDGANWNDSRTVAKGSSEARFEGMSQGTYYVRAAVFDLGGRVSAWVVSAPVTTGVNGLLDLNRSQNLILF
jgi:predicted phage tail protein